MTDDLVNKWPSTLVELLGIAEEVATKHGLDSESARVLSYNLITAIAEAFGGIQTYIPKGDTLKIAIRDRQIYQRHRQGNAAELAREYGLSEVHIYRIVQAQYKLHTRKIQPSLL